MDRRKLPGFSEEYPFVKMIPEERIIGNEIGQLFCVVPRSGDDPVEIIDFLLRPYRDLMMFATLFAKDGIASRHMAYLYMCQKNASPRQSGRNLR